jgi:hypothetical protein
MSACLKIDFEDEVQPAAGGDPTLSETAAPAGLSSPPSARTTAWWQGAIHVAALLGLLGLCALLCMVGLLWFSLAIEPG